MSDNLGVLVTDDKFKDVVMGVTGAALELGYEVSIFLTDHASVLSKDMDFLGLIERGAKLSVCGHSAERYDLKKEDIEGLGIRYATQFENAMIAQDSKRYLVF